MDDRGLRLDGPPGAAPEGPWAGPTSPADPGTFTVHYRLSPADLRAAGIVASRYSVAGNAVGEFALASRPHQARRRLGDPVLTHR